MSRWPTSAPRDWAARRYATCCPQDLLDVPSVDVGDTIIEVAAIMARHRSPLLAVMKGGDLQGVITASRLLAAALGR